MLTLLAEATGTLWMPVKATDFASEVDWLFYFIYWVCVAMFTLILVLLVFFAWKYRQTDRDEVASGPTHSTALELGWSLPPLIVVLYIFWVGFKGGTQLAVEPDNPYDVTVIAYKWGWGFRYPGGYVDGKLHVPQGVPVRLTIESRDVIHSVSIPSMRIKKDAVPGRYTRMWFQTLEDLAEAGQPREFDLYCAEYCGTNHSQMLTKVVVHTQEDFDNWLEVASRWYLEEAPWKAGERIWEQKCAQCHSNQPGVTLQGPTWAGVYGTERPLASGGSVLMDAEYIRESIFTPQAKIVRGFEGVIMASYQGQISEAEVAAIVEYFRKLNPEKYDPTRISDSPEGWKELLGEN